LILQKSKKIQHVSRHRKESWVFRVTRNNYSIVILASVKNKQLRKPKLFKCEQHSSLHPKYAQIILKSGTSTAVRLDLEPFSCKEA